MCVYQIEKLQQLNDQIKDESTRALGIAASEHEMLKLELGGLEEQGAKSRRETQDTVAKQRELLAQVSLSSSCSSCSSLDLIPHLLD